MINEKYNKKMMEIKKVGGYVERLTIIESDMSLDVDEGLLDKHILSLVENCIDAINQEYILASARQDINEIKDLKEQLSKCWCYGQEYKQIDCDEFGKVSDIVTQSNECNENGGI